MVALVLAERLAGVVIPLDDGGVVKSGVRHTDGEASRSGEQFNATHREISLWFVLAAQCP